MRQPLARCLQQQDCRGLIPIYLFSKKGRFEFSVRKLSHPQTGTHCHPKIANKQAITPSLVG